MTNNGRTTLAYNCIADFLSSILLECWWSHCVSFNELNGSVGDVVSEILDESYFTDPVQEEFFIKVLLFKKVFNRRPHESHVIKMSPSKDALPFESNTVYQYLFYFLNLYLM